ncbi:MAG: 1-phosphofructokinase family hexose kinase [Puniceicoccaceae bacterium]
MDVVTLTGNLLAEWTFDVDDLQNGRTHRANAMSFQVGGKGFNVARVLKRLGRRAEALGFAGGQMGEMCSQWLSDRAEEHRFFPLEEGVRPGLVIREENISSAETTFLGKDLQVTAEAWQAACEYIAQAGPTWLAITGSIPGWQSNWIEALNSLIHRCPDTSICADTYGPALSDLVRLPLSLVKINRTELSKLLPESAEAPARDLVAKLRSYSPVQNWIITDGPGSVLADFSNQGTYELIPAVIEEVSPTGSGDTFLAALLDAWIRGLNPEIILCHAASCATASAASPGIGDFPIPVPDCYLPTVRKVN